MNIKDQLNSLTIRKTMNTVEINKSIMELNYRKEKLQREVDDIQSQIYFLANLRESQRMTDDELIKIIKMKLGDSLTKPKK